MNQQIEQHVQNIKPALDVVSIGGVVGTLMGWLPAVAALLSIIWTLIRIYETKTVQNFIARFK
jgi:hypothetical protein